MGELNPGRLNKLLKDQIGNSIRIQIWLYSAKPMVFLLFSA